MAWFLLGPPELTEYDAITITADAPIRFRSRIRVRLGHQVGELSCALLGAALDARFRLLVEVEEVVGHPVEGGLAFRGGHVYLDGAEGVRHHRHLADLFAAEVAPDHDPRAAAALERDHTVEAVSLFGAEQLPVAGLRFLFHDLGQPLQSLDRLFGRGVVRRAEARQTKLAENRSNRVPYRTQEADDDVYLGLGELKVSGRDRGRRRRRRERGRRRGGRRTRDRRRAGDRERSLGPSSGAGREGHVPAGRGALRDVNRRIEAA